MSEMDGTEMTQREGTSQVLLACATCQLATHRRHFILINPNTHRARPTGPADLCWEHTHGHSDTGHACPPPCTHPQMLCLQSLTLTFAKCQHALTELEMVGPLTVDLTGPRLTLPGVMLH